MVLVLTIVIVCYCIILYCQSLTTTLVIGGLQLWLSFFLALRTIEAAIVFPMDRLESKVDQSGIG